MNKDIVLILLVFVFSLTITYAALGLRYFISNTFLFTLIIAILISIFFGVVMKLSSRKLQLTGGGLFRYSMLCHKCNWEWMSNTTEKEKPVKCPNCGSKDRLELVGWRKVQISPKKNNKELTTFFKKK